MKLEATRDFDMVVQVTSQNGSRSIGRSVIHVCSSTFDYSSSPYC